MPSLTTHRDFQSVRNLHFCYLCGEPFQQSDKAVDVDHVPPKTIFAKEDRQNPLVLKTHKVCNESHSEWDQLTGDMISVLHETGRKRQKIRKHLRVISAEERKLAIENVPLTRIIGRFIRGFHAALYHEYLPYKTNSAIDLPFPSGHRTEEGVEFDAIREHFPSFVEVLTKNRIAGNIDKITCYSGKCRYFCVWSTTDEGIPFCLFALRLYEWEALADTTNFPRRACVGGYFNGPPPENATRATMIEIPCRNTDPLDPFSD